jgi:hypothetical protein
MKVNVHKWRDIGKKQNYVKLFSFVYKFDNLCDMWNQ